MFTEPPPRPLLIRPTAPEADWRRFDPLIGICFLIGSLTLMVLLLGILVVFVDFTGTAKDFVAAAITIGFEVLFGLGVLVLARRRGISLKALGFRRPDRWGPLGIAVVGAYATLFAYGIGITLLRQVGVDTTTFDQGNEIPIDEDSGTLLLVGLLVVFGFAVVVVAPMAEELFFRGLLFRSLDGRWGTWLAIAASGFAFGAFHVSLSVLLPFTVIGMIFAWAFKASGSLWVTILAHFIFNSVALILTVIGIFY